jgi:hypothetical protein
MASLRAKFVGGIQWAITGSYIFLFAFLVTVWFLNATRTVISLDLSWAFAGFVVAAFVAGYLWVESRSPAPGAHDRRIEVVITMLVLGFVLPFAIPGLLDAFGLEIRFPLAGFGMAYALTLALSYGLVYGLGLRVFLGPEEPEGPDTSDSGE